MVKMGTKAMERVRRFCDWMDISRMVKRYINEDSDYFVIEKGEFCVRFDATNKKKEERSER